MDRIRLAGTFHLLLQRVSRAVSICQDANCMPNRAFPTHYRLVGPWRDPDAHHIVRTEILETITRRGIGGNLMMGVIPMVFYAFVNLLAFVLHGTLGFFDRLAPKTTSKLTNSFRM